MIILGMILWLSCYLVIFNYIISCQIISEIFSPMAPEAVLLDQSLIISMYLTQNITFVSGVGKAHTKYTCSC